MLLKKWQEMVCSEPHFSKPGIGKLSIKAGSQYGKRETEDPM